MAQISFAQVGKVYPGVDAPVCAVEDFDLQINDREFMALLGPSGCGKSSTLRMVVGLEQITSGTISFDGRPVNELSPQQRNVAMGFESYALYPNFTVRQNLSFTLEIAGLGAEQIDQRVSRISDLLDIGAILERRPGELSGGQQQRVSLGRALVREPAAFILDEVMSHVDSQLKFRMLGELSRVHREVGRTTLYVTHDQLEALALADRIAVMNQARLQQVGTSQDLFLRPDNLFVAGFIGEPAMNLLDATITDGAVVAADGALQVPLANAAVPAERSLQLGFRPQHCVLDANSTQLRAQVEVREYLGERVVYALRAGAYRFKVAADPDSSWQVGDQVGCQIDAPHLLLFDAGSTARVEWQPAATD